LYQFSKRSLSKLEGVHPDLVAVANRAIQLTKVDFGLTEGLRTVERQKKLVAAGKSQTMNSKHIEGKAVDTLVYIGKTHSWDLSLYDDVADAFAAAGRELGVSLRWGAAWSVGDITKWNGTMEEAMLSYIDLRRSQGRRPFIDGPHFELV